jgi:hypothetical protein
MKLSFFVPDVKLSLHPEKKRDGHGLGKHTDVKALVQSHKAFMFVDLFNCIEYS